MPELGSEKQKACSLCEDYLTETAAAEMVKPYIAVTIGKLLNANAKSYLKNKDKKQNNFTQNNNKLQFQSLTIHLERTSPRCFLQTRKHGNKRSGREPE